jgi:uncharacterized membrane protein
MPSARVTDNFGLIFWGMAALGVAIRLGLAFGFVGDSYDQESFAMVRDALKVAPFDVYDEIVDGHWNYPPGLFPWIALAGWLADVTGLAFHGVVQLPAIAADVAIAWVVQLFLAGRGFDPARRLAAAGLVLLGPVFVAIAGYHGQIDSVAILPAVLAFLYWERGGERRALQAGLLLGAAIVLKTAPGLLLLALVPTARSLREAVKLVAAAAAIPLLMLAPYLIADARHALSAIDYPSVGTAGGLGLISTTLPNPVVDGIRDLGTVWNALWIGGLLALFLRFRPSATRAAVIVWLALFVFGTGFYMHYLIWGIPFLLLDGALLVAALIQLVVLVPLIVTYAGLFGSFVANRAFDVPMLALWLLCVGLLADRVVRAIRDGGSSRASPAAAPASR